ncbi:MAG: hypothetical protein IPO78_04160 [Saprospiraceae bacterium]|nr:hypothetical protein [Saprospiraceae bacterium]MBK9720797.1 hypothetical protein [Saprospiraceae bacterium]MBK9727785.1 hypothetical protein [Saprospiraceae bacterium]
MCQKLFLLMSITFSLLACDSKPKVIQKVSSENSGSLSKSPESNEGETHKVTIEEVLQAKRYTYLKVKEGEEPYWIAIAKMEIDKNATYYYSGGLKMRNFQSTDFDRVFEEVTLVSKIGKTADLSTGSALDQAFSKVQKDEQTTLEIKNVKPEKGSIAIADLFKNKEKYEGKTILVKGQCVKINPQIMGRNWIHLKDGSGGTFDLTVTTQEHIELGSVVLFEGKIALNKDFGAGYFFNIIMEEAILK